MVAETERLLDSIAATVPGEVPLLMTYARGVLSVPTTYTGFGPTVICCCKAGLLVEKMPRPPVGGVVAVVGISGTKMREAVPKVNALRVGAVTVVASEV